MPSQDESEGKRMQRNLQRRRIHGYRKFHEVRRTHFSPDVEMQSKYYRLPVELVERIRNACAAYNLSEGAFVADQLALLCDMYEHNLNGGAPFPTAPPRKPRRSV